MREGAALSQSLMRPHCQTARWIGFPACSIAGKPRNYSNCSKLFLVLPPSIWISGPLGRVSGDDKLPCQRVAGQLPPPHFKRNLAPYLPACPVTPQRLVALMKRMCHRVAFGVRQSAQVICNSRIMVKAIHYNYYLT